MRPTLLFLAATIVGLAIPIAFLLLVVHCRGNDPPATPPPCSTAAASTPRPAR